MNLSWVCSCFQVVISLNCSWHSIFLQFTNTNFNFSRHSVNFSPQYAFQSICSFFFKIELIQCSFITQSLGTFRSEVILPKTIVMPAPLNASHTSLFPLLLLDMFHFPFYDFSLLQTALYCWKFHIVIWKVEQ